jgi:signal transduction histidine kinase
LINDVLDLSKMEAGKIEWKREPVMVNDLLNRATAAIAALFEQKGLALVKEIPVDLPLITCDADRIIQVGINLLSNALKFTDNGSVIIRAERTEGAPLPGSAVKISIIDTGIGISEEDRKQVFEKFKQVGDTLTDRPKGTGLGLPICKQIIEYHGGTIWAERSPGGGSIFSFILPGSPPEEAAATA